MGLGWEQVVGIWLEARWPGAHLEAVKISITCIKEWRVQLEALSRAAR